MPDLTGSGIGSTILESEPDPVPGQDLKNFDEKNMKVLTPQVIYLICLYPRPQLPQLSPSSFLLSIHQQLTLYAS